jgi:hypothetical protein
LFSAEQSDSGGSGEDGIRDERLPKLGEVVLELGRSLVEDDLEGLQYLMTQLSLVGESKPQLAEALHRWIEQLQSTVAEHWGGLHLSNRRWRCLEKIV